MCFQELLSSSIGLSSQYVVSVGSLEQYESCVDRVGVEVVETLARAMQKRGICILMIHGSVEDSLLNEFVKRGLYTVGFNLTNFETIREAKLFTY